MDFTFATEPEIRAELGKRFATLRIARGLSQSEIAKKATVGIATLQRFEQGDGATLSNCIRLFIALGRVDDLSNLLQPKSLTINTLEEKYSTKPRQRASRKSNL